jgi:hypothetical protein
VTVGGLAGSVHDHHVIGGYAHGGRGVQRLGEQHADGDQHAGARVDQLLGDVLRGEQGVDRGGGGPGPQDPVECHREGCAVGCKQPDHIADGDPTRGQRAGERVDLPDEPAVGDRGAGCQLDECRSVGVVFAEAGEQVFVQRRRRDLDRGKWTGDSHDTLDRTMPERTSCRCSMVAESSAESESNAIGQA